MQSNSEQQRTQWPDVLYKMHGGMAMPYKKIGQQHLPHTYCFYKDSLDGAVRIHFEELDKYFFADELACLRNGLAKVNRLQVVIQQHIQNVR